MKYDAWNRMTAVYADNGSGEPGTVIVTCRYDGLTRRVRRSATPQGALDP